MSILDAYPQPKLLKIAGREVLVSQLLVKDLAALQAYLEMRVPHPLESARRELSSLEGKDRKRLLARLRREDAEYPPVLHDEVSERIFMTQAGLAYWLMVACNKHGQQMGERDALALADIITHEELSSIQRVAYDVHPQDELHRMVYPDQQNGGTAPDWAVRIDEVATSHGWRYEYVGNLTLSQFSLALRGEGRTRRPAPDISHLSHEELVEELKKQREEFGLDN